MYMGKMTIVIDDELEREFRMAVARRYGVRKGALGIAVSEAIKMWIKKVKETGEEE